jgi:hypothetical protein
MSNPPHIPDSRRLHALEYAQALEPHDATALHDDLAALLPGRGLSPVSFELMHAIRTRRVDPDRVGKYRFRNR